MALFGGPQAINSAGAGVRRVAEGAGAGVRRAAEGAGAEVRCWVDSAGAELRSPDIEELQILAGFYW